MLVLGLAFGAVAYSTSQYLMVKLGGGNLARGLASRGLPRHVRFLGAAPKLAAFLAYFGAIFADHVLVEAGRSPPSFAAANLDHIVDDPRRVGLAARLGRSRSPGVL